MSKAFTKEVEDSDDDFPQLPRLPASGKNYITPAGYARTQAELLSLIDLERPQVVDAVHWAASNGDRSENGDYIYGKKRLREIDRRIRFLTQRLEIMSVTDPRLHHGSEQIFFGATVTYIDNAGAQTTVTIWVQTKPTVPSQRSVGYRRLLGPCLRPEWATFCSFSRPLARWA